MSCVKTFKSPAKPSNVRLTLSLPRVINFKFPLQPRQKYYITQYEELGFSSLTQLRDDYAFNSHYLTHASLFKRLGEWLIWLIFYAIVLENSPSINLSKAHWSFSLTFLNFSQLRFSARDIHAEAPLNKKISIKIIHFHSWRCLSAKKSHFCKRVLFQNAVFTCSLKFAWRSVTSQNLTPVSANRARSSSSLLSKRSLVVCFDEISTRPLFHRRPWAFYVISIFGVADTPGHIRSGHANSVWQLKWTRTEIAACCSPLLHSPDFYQRLLWERK